MTWRRFIYVFALAFLFSVRAAFAKDDAEEEVTLGFEVQSTSDADARLTERGAPTLAQRKCVVVKHVDPNGPASQQILPDHAIVSINGIPISDVVAFQETIKQLKAGSQVTIKGLYLVPEGRKFKWKNGTAQITASRVGEIAIAPPAERMPAPEANLDPQIDPSKPGAAFLSALTKCRETRAPNEPSKITEIDTSPQTVEEPIRQSLILPDKVYSALRLPAESSDPFRDIVPPPEENSEPLTIPEFDFLDPSGYFVAVARPTRHDLANEVTLTRLPSKSALEPKDRKVTAIYRPLALSPSAKHLVSLDGEFIRVWQITENEGLRLYCSARGGDDLRAVQWLSDDLIAAFSTSPRFSHSMVGRYFLLSDHKLSRCEDPLVKFAPDHGEAMSALGLAESVIRVSLGDLPESNYSNRLLLSKTDFANQHLLATVPIDGFSVVAAFPNQNRLQTKSPSNLIERQSSVLTCLHAPEGGKTFYVSGVVAGESKDSVGPKLTLLQCDAKTLLPIRRIALDENDSVVAFSLDGRRMAVMRKTVARLAQSTAISHALFIYSLDDATLESSFALGEAFELNDSIYPDNLIPTPAFSFSDDNASLYVALAYPPVFAREAGMVAPGELRLASWSADTGDLEGFTSRLDSDTHARDISDLNLQPCFRLAVKQDGFCIASVADATSSTEERQLGVSAGVSLHAFSIGDLLVTQGILTEGHSLRRAGNIKGAREKYLQAMARHHEWFFRDHYPAMLLTAIDCYAVEGKEEEARVLVECLKDLKQQIDLTSQPGKELAGKIAKEDLQRAEERMRAAAQAEANRAAEFAKLRAGNKAQHRKAATLTKQEFIKVLDTKKAEGIIGPPTLLRYFDFAFEDIIGDPDQLLDLQDGKAVYMYHCRDGIVSLKVVRAPQQGVVVVTELETR